MSVARFAARLSARAALDTGDPYGPFDIACGHDARGAASLSLGLNVRTGRHFVGPELVSLVTTGERRFTLISPGLGFRL